MKPKIAHLYKWIVDSMQTVDPDEAAKHTNRLLQIVFDNYCNENNQEKLSYRLTVPGSGDTDGMVKYVIVDDLKFVDDIFFGSIGITDRTLQGMVRRRDLETMKSGEITLPSPKQNFEVFTFFAIHVVQRRLIILHNKDLPQYIHNLVSTICTNAICSEPYTFKAELFSEISLRERLSELNQTKVEIGFALHDLEMGKKPGMSKICQRALNHGSCKLYISGKFKSKLTDEDIQEIIDIAMDNDCKTLKVHDLSEEKGLGDALDVLRDIVQEKRKIYLTSAEAKNPNLVYEAFKNVFSPIISSNT